MEVAIISSTDPNIVKPGGTRPYVLNLMHVLTGNGIKVTLFGSSGDAGGGSSNYSFDFVPLVRDYNTSEIKFAFNLLMKAHSFKLKRSTLIHAQRPDLLLPFIIYYRKNPKVCTLHGTGYTCIYCKKGKFLGGAYRLIERIALKRADRIIAVDENTGIFYSTLYPWLKDKIFVIPVGIDTTIFKPMDRCEMREKYGFREADKIILYVGRFEEEKGLDLLLKSFKEVKKEIHDCKLVLVGAGRERGNLEAFANSLGLNDITFMDPLEHEKISELMNCADVFALSSLHEGMPTVVLEALACGIPVVSTDVGDVNKVVKDAETGYIVKTRTTEEMSAGLITVLANSAKFKERCLEVAHEYSRDEIAKRIIVVYNGIIGKN